MSDLHCYETGKAWRTDNIIDFKKEGGFCDQGASFDQGPEKELFITDYIRKQPCIWDIRSSMYTDEEKDLT